MASLEMNLPVPFRRGFQATIQGITNFDQNLSSVYPDFQGFIRMKLSKIKKENFLKKKKDSIFYRYSLKINRV